MRKFQLKDFMKASAGFWFVAATGIDSALLSLDRVGWLKTDSGWYLTGPLIAWSAVALPLSIALFERMNETALKRPGSIQPIITDGSATARAIPWNKPTGASTIFASVTASIFGSEPPRPPARAEVIAYRVPVGEQTVTVRLAELKGFLEISHRRQKHQFSRPYWTQRRRPRLPEVKYNAFMTLLETAGLIENRTFGASGRLTIFPQEAYLRLKHVGTGFEPVYL